MLRTLRTLLAAVAVGAAPATVAAADTADITLARAVLAATDADPQLRTLLVSVKDGVAVLGGPVPSAAVARRAEEVVRAVPGVGEVRNRCYVQAAPDPLLRPVQDWPRALPPRRLLAELPGVAPSAPEPPPAVAAAPIERSRSLKPSAPAENVLLPPVGASGGPAPPTSRPSAPAVLTGHPAGPLDVAEAARRADPRFAGLTLTARDGGLVIGGAAGRAADAWDLAQNLRGIPGVGWVAVGPVAVK